MTLNNTHLGSDPSRIHWLDWLLVSGFVLSPMTGLRVGKIGPSETLTLAWAILALIASPNRSMAAPSSRPVVTYWVLFLASATTGAIIGGVLVPLQAQPSGLITWLYFAMISLGIFIGCGRRTREQLERLLYTASLTATLWYSCLYLLGLRTPVFFGAPLWYASTDRFSGGADNPHQLALLLSVILFVNIRDLLRRRSTGHRLLVAVLILIIIRLGASTGVSSFWVAVVVPLFLLPLLVETRLFPSMRHRLVSLVVVSPTLIFAWILLDLGSRSLDFISSDPNGLGRIELWASIGDVLSVSPWFGLGPGVHAWGGTIEYHSAYLEIIAMAGLCGLVLFFWFTIHIVKGTRADPTLVLIILPLYVYGLSGFTVRRLVFWITVTMVLSIGSKTLSTVRGSPGRPEGATPSRRLARNPDGPSCVEFGSCTRRSHVR